MTFKCVYNLLGSYISGLVDFPRELRVSQLPLYTGKPFRLLTEATCSETPEIPWIFLAREPLTRQSAVVEVLLGERWLPQGIMFPRKCVSSEE